MRWNNLLWWTHLSPHRDADAIIAGAVNEDKRRFGLANATSSAVYHLLSEGTETDTVKQIELSDPSDNQLVKDVSPVNEFAPFYVLNATQRGFDAAISYPGFIIVS